MDRRIVNTIIGMAGAVALVLGGLAGCAGPGIGTGSGPSAQPSAPAATTPDTTASPSPSATSPSPSVTNAPHLSAVNQVAGALRDGEGARMYAGPSSDAQSPLRNEENAEVVPGTYALSVACVGEGDLDVAFAIGDQSVQETQHCTGNTVLTEHYTLQIAQTAQHMSVTLTSAGAQTAQQLTYGMRVDVEG